MAYNNSDKLIKLLYKDFENFKKQNKDEPIEISSLDQFKMEFSAWVKSPNNKNIIDENIKNIMNNCRQNWEKNYKINEKFCKLFKELLLLYLHCELSFPPIEINFNLEESYFNSNNMIDYFQIGKRCKAKVNFVYLPSLISNGCYLDNGKQWVFNYIDKNKKTFFFEKPELESLINPKEILKPEIFQKLKIEIKKKISYFPILNYKISKDAENEFIYYIIKKNKNDISNIIKKIVKPSIELDENEEIIKIEFNLNGKTIIIYDNNKNM
jgi:hypothetical protein